MNIKDIDKLARNTESELLFDLTKLTFQHKYADITYSSYVVQKGESMRIDLVCNSIYGNIDYVDVLLNVNNILNPLNIQEGSILKYPSDIGQIESLRPKEVSPQNTQSLLANNKDKVTKVDPARQAYIEQGYNLPPNVLEQPTEQIS